VPIQQNAQFATPSAQGLGGNQANEPMEWPSLQAPATPPASFEDFLVDDELSDTKMTKDLF
jgi:hypothetical protein